MEGTVDFPVKFLNPANPIFANGVLESHVNDFERSRFGSHNVIPFSRFYNWVVIGWNLLSVPVESTVKLMIKLMGSPCASFQSVTTPYPLGLHYRHGGITGEEKPG